MNTSTGDCHVCAVHVNKYYGRDVYRYSVLSSWIYSYALHYQRTGCEIDNCPARGLTKARWSSHAESLAGDLQQEHVQIREGKIVKSSY